MVPSDPRRRPCRRRCRLAAWLALAALAPAAEAAASLEAGLYVTGLAYPLFATAPEGDSRLFIVERAGQIRIAVEGMLLPAPFLDIRSQVSTGGERGLLGLAFSPDYALDGLFYVYYTNLAGDSVVSRFQVSGDPDVADATSELPLIAPIVQPYPNHNGGTVAFSPLDGFLYFAPGDGGSANDPDERAQDPTDLLGKMLRIDVTGAPPVAPEIWALGLRNPYRFSFDRETGDLWIADVGQARLEEIDLEPAGDPGMRNYGWDVMEGTLCNFTDPALPPAAPPCNDPVFTPPLYEYDHSEGNCSITGGFLYQGAIAELRGQYVFGDWCTGRIWTLDPATALATDRSAELGPAAAVPFELVGFGEDGQGELYVIHSGGDVFRIRSPEVQCSDGLDNDGDGALDFPEDPGCFGPAGAREDPQCQDGLDNDSDGRIDFDGGAAAGLPPPQQTDPDPQCTAPWKNRERRRRSCGLGFELVLLLPLLPWARAARRVARG